MLRIENIDLEVLAEALLSYDDFGFFYWIDPATGAIGFWGDGANYGAANEELDPEERGGLRIDPIPSRDAYRDMEEFTATVRDPKIRDQLLRALDGKKPFHNFNAAVHRHTETPRQWHAFRDSAMEVRAVQWLQEHELVKVADAEQALAKLRGGPESAEL